MGASRILLTQILLVLFSLIRPSISLTPGYEIPIYRDDSKDSMAASEKKLIRFGAIAEWDDINQINTNDKLAGIVRQGCAEVAGMLKKKNDPNNNPTTMVGIRAGNRIYLSSSGKKNQFFYGPKDDKIVVKADQVCTAVRATLERCSVVESTDSRHKFKANCGEIYALQSYCINNNVQGSTIDELQGAPSVAVACDYENPDNSKIVKPCDDVGGGNTKDQFGCGKVLEKLGIDGAGDGQPGQGFTDPTVRPKWSIKSCIILPKAS